MEGGGLPPQRWVIASGLVASSFKTSVTFIFVSFFFRPPCDVSAKFVTCRFGDKFLSHCDFLLHASASYFPKFRHCHVSAAPSIRMRCSKRVLTDPLERLSLSLSLSLSALSRHCPKSRRITVGGFLRLNFDTG